MDKYLRLVTDNLVSLVVNIASSVLILWIATLAAQKWPKTTRRKWLIRLGLALFILILSAVTLSVILTLTKRIESAQPVFSDFTQDSPLNNYGIEWRVFNDSRYNGNSYVTIGIRRYTHNDNYAVISFNLGDKATVSPYCGVVSGFSARLGEPRDISMFEGVQLEVWHEEDFPSNVRVYLQISPSRLIGQSEGYYQYDITDHVRKHDITDHAKQDGSQSEIAVSFSKFGDPPTRTGPPTSFDKTLRTEVYQIAIGIQGEKGKSCKGKIAFDNLAFYR